jgi:hypothetical protein
MADIPAGFEIETLPEGFEVESLPDGFEVETAPQERTYKGAISEAVGEAIPSAGRLVSDIYTAVTNPSQTLDAFNNLLGGYLQKGADKFGGGLVTAGGEDMRPYADLVNQYMVDRYGGEQELLNTLATDPAGLAADVAGVLTGGAGLVGKAAATGGKVASLAQKAGQLGSAIDPIANMVRAGKAVSKIPSGMGAVGRGLTGVTTGGGTKSIERAISGGEYFKKALKGEVGVSDIVDSAQNAMAQFRDMRRAKYIDDFAKLKESDTMLDLTPVRASFQESLDKFGVRRGGDGSLDFSRSVLDGDPKAMEAVMFIDNKLVNWGTEAGDLTVVGLDTLKRNFDNYFAETNGARAVISDARANVKNLLNQVDGYADMTADYQKATDFISEIEKTFSIDKNPDTVMRKLNQAVKDNFELRGQLLDQIDAELGTSLVDMIAGNQMSSWMAKNMVGRFAGMAGAGFLIGEGISRPVLATLFISSPKAVASTLRTLGVPKRAVKKFIAERPKLKKQFDAIMKAADKTPGSIVTGARAAIPAVRVEQATGEYDTLIKQGAK